MKVVILCGGKGTRLREETSVRPKPMVEIGGHPILWHIMRTYAHYGFNEFILCLGYMGEVIREYFYHYTIRNSDFTLDLSSGTIEYHGKQQIPNWRITFVDTGQDTMTGGRVKKIEPYINEDFFFLTYGDGVTDLDISKSLEFHKAHGLIGTITGVSPPSRYGELLIEDEKVISFAEKPVKKHDFINGGYFVLSKKIFDYLSDNADCVFEREPLEKIAREGQLRVYQHHGFWQCMDTYRDYKFLENLWKSPNAPWRVE